MLNVNGDIITGDSGPEAMVGALVRHVLEQSERIRSRYGGTFHLTEGEAITCVRDVLFACNRTESGGDTYFCVNSLLCNPDLVVLTPHGSCADPLEITVEVVRSKFRSGPPPPHPAPSAPPLAQDSMTGVVLGVASVGGRMMTVLLDDLCDDSATIDNDSEYLVDDYVDAESANNDSIADATTDTIDDANDTPRVNSVSSSQANSLNLNDMKYDGVEDAGHSWSTRRSGSGAAEESHRNLSEDLSRTVDENDFCDDGDFSLESQTLLPAFEHHSSGGSADTKSHSFSAPTPIQVPTVSLAQRAYLKAASSTSGSISPNYTTLEVVSLHQEEKERDAISTFPEFAATQSSSSTRSESITFRSRSTSRLLIPNPFSKSPSKKKEKERREKEKEEPVLQHHKKDQLSISSAIDKSDTDKKPSSAKESHSSKGGNLFTRNFSLLRIGSRLDMKSKAATNQPVESTKPSTPHTSPSSIPPFASSSTKKASRLSSRDLLSFAKSKHNRTNSFTGSLPEILSPTMCIRIQVRK